MGIADYTRQTESFQARRDALRDVRAATLQDVDGVDPSTTKASEIAESGLYRGQFLTMSEDILQLPWSITLVGVGATHVANVHDILISEENGA